MFAYRALCDCWFISFYYCELGIYVNKIELLEKKTPKCVSVLFLGDRAGSE